jgi:hypothetical protein
MDIRPGDQFTTADGRVATVRNVTPARAAENVSCYGLHTEGTHDMFANGVLAHDSSMPPPGFSAWREASSTSEGSNGSVDGPHALFRSVVEVIAGFLRKAFSIH